MKPEETQRPHLRVSIPEGGGQSLQSLGAKEVPPRAHCAVRPSLGRPLREHGGITRRRRKRGAVPGEGGGREQPFCSGTKTQKVLEPLYRTQRRCYGPGRVNQGSSEGDVGKERKGAFHWSFLAGCDTWNTPPCHTEQLKSPSSLHCSLP